MNELATESSLYLQQHAQNPVHWKAWNDKTLSNAIEQDRLLIISIGYSACHWCHVMEREVFETEEAAAAMNCDFTSIKVDREERPDVDAIYMKALQLISGRGGWPLNIVALPDGRPVWGATYVPRGQWIETLAQIVKLRREKPEVLEDYATQVQQGIAKSNLIPPKQEENPISSSVLEPLIAKWKQNFDPEFGGHERAPKFMMPVNQEFLLRYAAETGDPALELHVKLTLDKMAMGGIFDTIGGGFSRYSVDMRWHVPHFEKMLYDNGQMLSLYAQAYKRFGEPLYREVLQKTIDFLERDMQHPDGYFFAALDADSLDAAGFQREGAFYTWTKNELEALLGADFEDFSTVYNINAFGHWENGHYVLIQSKDAATQANTLNTDLETLRTKKRHWEAKLHGARNSRHKPGRDEKGLTSWNALTISGLIHAHEALAEQKPLSMAIRAAEHLLNRCLTPSGKLFRNYSNGTAVTDGFSDDYAFAIKCFIDLYGATSDEKWITKAYELCEFAFRHFFDETAGYFSFTAKDATALIAPHFEMEDNVMPASNSVMCRNLQALSVYYGHTEWARTAHQMLTRMAGSIDYPPAFANWLTALLSEGDSQRELAICGPEATEYAKKLSAHYLPHVWVAAATSPSELPLLKNRHAGDKTQFYICRQQRCDLPKTNFEDVENELISLLSEPR